MLRKRLARALDVRFLSWEQACAFYQVDARCVMLRVRLRVFLPLCDLTFLYGKRHERNAILIVDEGGLKKH